MWDFVFTNGRTSRWSQTLDYGVKDLPASFPESWVSLFNQFCCEHIHVFTESLRGREPALVLVGKTGGIETVIMYIKVRAGKALGRDNFIAEGMVFWPGAVDSAHAPEWSWIAAASVPQQTLPYHPHRMWLTGALTLFFLGILSLFWFGQIKMRNQRETIPLTQVQTTPAPRPALPSEPLPRNGLGKILSDDFHKQLALAHTYQEQAQRGEHPLWQNLRKYVCQPEQPSVMLTPAEMADLYLQAVPNNVPQQNLLYVLYVYARLQQENGHRLPAIYQTVIDAYLQVRFGKEKR